LKKLPHINGLKPRKNIQSILTSFVNQYLNKNQEAAEVVIQGYQNTKLNYPKLPDFIDRNYILESAKRIDANGFSPHPDSHTYDVIIDDKAYPPLPLLAFALEADSGDKFKPGDLSIGGVKPAFKLLKQAGFEPVLKKHLQRTIDDGQLDESVDRLRKLSPTLDDEPEGNPQPKAEEVSVIKIERDPRVKRWVLDNANGICELCGEQAPFQNKKGHWYLEVHHVIPLKDKGPDTIKNAVALCPNCHMRCHHSNDSENITKSLIEKVSRLNSFR